MIKYKSLGKYTLYPFFKLLFTTRKWFKKNTTIDPDKIIYLEHPNFADFILNSLNKRGSKQYVSFWPLRIRSIDFNLVSKFIFKKN